MGKKFLIIDDSALMRRVISDIIKNNSEYDVLDFACDGVEGLDRLVSHPSYYDLVILDINMPKMSGIEVLEMLQKNKMHEVVVVVSTVAKEGAKETMRALELGALEFVTKPENFYEVKGEGFKANIVRLINLTTKGSDLNRMRLESSVRPVSPMPLKNLRQNAGSLEPVKKDGTISPAVPDGLKGIKKGMGKLVAIACSTGGPKSLQMVIPKLPVNLDAGVVLVQHMPKGFTASLAHRLNSISQIAVKEAEDGDVIEKGHVYIAPGGMHIVVSVENGAHVIHFNDIPAVDGLKPCANIMYESLKSSRYDEITCVVLTGMGADGTRGIESLSKAGRQIYVIGQDEPSCVVYGMPRALAQAGLTDEVVSLEKVAESIIKNVGVQ